MSAFCDKTTCNRAYIYIKIYHKETFTKGFKYTFYGTIT